MSNLLTEAVKAHGGLDRWRQFDVLEANLAVGGAIWGFRQQPGLFDKVTFEIDLHQERVRSMASREKSGCSSRRTA
jgi:hypothetical protein